MQTGASRVSTYPHPNPHPNPNPRCEPCKQLTPALEKLVVAAQGAVRLAKVNVDNLPEIASALQVKELPTVMVVHKGKLVESFKGGLPPEKLKEFVDRVVALAGGPASGKRALEEAAILLGEGKLPEATQAYADLTALPEHAASATAGLAMCALTLYYTLTTYYGCTYYDYTY